MFILCMRTYGLSPGVRVLIDQKVCDSKELRAALQIAAQDPQWRSCFQVPALNVRTTTVYFLEVCHYKPLWHTARLLT